MIPAPGGRFAIVTVVASTAAAIAMLMMGPLLDGLLLLLRDVFGVLALPFSFLFGMAGNTDHAARLDHVMGGMGAGLPRHPARALGAAALCALNVVLFLLAHFSQAPGTGARLLTGGAAATALAAGWLGGPAVALVLLPGLIAEIRVAARPLTRT